MNKKVFLVIGLLVLVVLVLTGCGTATTTPAATTSAPSTTTAAPPATTAVKTTPPPNTAPPVTTTVAPPTSAVKKGGVLIIQNTAGPQSFGVPTLMGLDSTTIGCSIPAVQTLVSYDNKGQAYPVLAESWKVDPAAKTITFTIRKGVKFHDGTDLDAAAVAWNLDQMIQAKVSAAANWLSVAVLDQYTVMLKLTEYKATAMAAFDGTGGAIISPTAYKLNGQEWAKTHPVGTGPFMLKTFVRDSVTEYVKNPNYWEPGKPYLDGIKFVVITDTTTARMTFEAGQVDIITQVAGDTAKDLTAKGDKLEQRPGTVMVLLPDSKNATSPFAKKGVREAVEYALDRPTISTTLGYGFWEPLTQAAAKFQSGYNPAIKAREFNVATAKQKLADAGYPNGVAITITTSSSFAQDTVTAMMGYLNAVGFKCTITSLTQAAWTTASNTGWTNSLLWATQGATDAEYVSFLERYYAGNATRYPVLAKPQALTDKINAAIFEPDYTKRVAMCQEAVQIMQDDCTSINVYHGPALFVEKTYVMDAKFNSLAGAGFRWDAVNVWLNK
jgi:peptide/nickel transport system substrate-binding protein